MQDKEKPTEQYYVGSVLLGDHIKSFVERGLLIVDDTFNKGQLRRAKYQVRLGKSYYKAGEYGNLDDNNPLLKIGPYELVFVESYEIFKLPENVIAKYDLNISGCLAGIGLQTGLQLDPTYWGRFFCPLFNFSDTAVTLKYKEQLASVDFIYTTPPTPESEEIEAFGKEKYGLLSLSNALPPVSRRSGLEELWTNVKKTEERLEKRVEEGRREMQNVNMVFFMVIGIMVAAMAGILVPEAIGRVTPALTPWWAVVTIMAGVVAIIYLLGRFIHQLFRQDKASDGKSSRRES